MGVVSDNAHGPAWPKVFAPLFSKSGRFLLSERESRAPDQSEAIIL
jgi:hypothetical protein